MIEVLGKRPLVMGILNVTPDSFSGDGVVRDGDFVPHAVTLASQMLQDGADIIDVGGESTRPGATPVGTEEELRRVVPVIEALRQAYPHVIISIDTMKAEVAKAAVQAGAQIINDVSGAKADAQIYEIAAQADAYLVLMHNVARAAEGPSYLAPDYKGDVVQSVRRELASLIERAKAASVRADRLIIDPGLGFGKTTAQNLRLINQCDQLAKLGLPVMIGASRKSFIGQALDLPVEQRLEGTAACVAVSVLRGASILRVHDVKEMTRIARMSHAITRA